MHKGNNVVANLAPFGITADCLPTAIGGTYVFSERAYLLERMKEEGSIVEIGANDEPMDTTQ